MPGTESLIEIGAVKMLIENQHTGKSTQRAKRRGQNPAATKTGIASIDDSEWESSLLEMSLTASALPVELSRDVALAATDAGPLLGREVKPSATQRYTTLP